MKIVWILLIAALQLQHSCHSQGTSWTDEEAEIIKKKLIACFFTKPGKCRKQLASLHPDHDYFFKTKPNGAKLLRLGFHDCLTYKDPDGTGINGCDGCLNSNQMGLNLFEFYNTSKGQANGPDITITDNNGLLFTADMLEEIYTNANFPKHKKLPKLDISMEKSGKSRADLWAFASLVAVEYGIENNNLACDGTPRSILSFSSFFELLSSFFGVFRLFRFVSGFYGFFSGFLCFFRSFSGLFELSRTFRAFIEHLLSFDKAFSTFRSRA